ncbi:MAG: hypothetical protein E6K54_05355 [Gammaproteobacteria bacterium]|nr:MAG: hypothetical protein E6K54_05355 [Gammaproteobacteria bacterium]
MPNNENYYRIKFEFANFLKGFPEFIVVHSDWDGYVNVTIQADDFSRANSLVSHRTPQHLIEQLFQELEKDYIEAGELLDLGRLFKNYLLLLKHIQHDRTYYKITPGMMVGLFFALHSCLLFFPNNKELVYASLIADFYSLGFWLFSVWSWTKNEQDLFGLETRLMEKIKFLQLLSTPPQADEFYLESSLSSSASRLPTYQEVLLEAARIPTITVSANTSHFFYLSRLDECSDSHENENEADLRIERCYSI